ncbi:MAG TPA: hypothetical protein VFY93_13125 [Planctomycetota bacterium]|nr:hypothetical protein [Planctomycetota bacterium]
MRRLGLLLCLALVARAGDEQPQVHVYDVADLKAHDTWYAVAVARVRAAAEGTQVRAEGKTLIVVAPAAVHEKIGRELKEIRARLGRLVHIEVRFVKAEGGLGVASVPAQDVDALLKEKHAESLAAPKLTCYDGQKASVSVTRQVSCVSDFKFATDGQGNATADPVVETLPNGVMARLRPFARDGGVRVVAEVTVSEVNGQMPEIELPFPLAEPAQIQVPEGTTRSVTKVVDCAPDEYTVLDLGGGRAVLIRATALSLKDASLEDVQLPPGEEFPGKEIELK